MDFMAGHLLADRFARRIVAGPYTDGEDTPTPAKEPGRGGPFDPGSFRDDLAPPKLPPTKPTPPGIRRPDVPMLGQPQSLQVTRQPPMPGLEMPAEQIPGENGRPMGMPQRMPGMMPPPRMPAPAPMLRNPLAPKHNAPPSPGLKGPPKTPSLKAPKPVSHSPATKPPHQQSEPSRPSSPKQSGDAPKSKSRLSDMNFLNTTGENEQPGAMPNAAPMMSPSAPPVPPTQQMGLPSVGGGAASGAGVQEPDWGHGSGNGNHISDEGPDWGGHGLIDDPDWNSARRKGFMFSRLSLRG